LAVKITKETLYIHLKHLEKEGLINREEIDAQKVFWVLNQDHPVERLHAETVGRWVDSLENWRSKKSRPPPPRWRLFDRKEHYEKLPQAYLDSEIDSDIKAVMFGNLCELKALVGYDLMDDSDFWKVFGNPLYRLCEKSIAENCRVSERYRNRFLEKIELEIQTLK
jgi:hypothetical protein